MAGPGRGHEMRRFQRGGEDGCLGTGLGGEGMLRSYRDPKECGTVFVQGGLKAGACFEGGSGVVFFSIEIKGGNYCRADESADGKPRPLAPFVADAAH